MTWAVHRARYLDCGLGALGRWMGRREGEVEVDVDGQFGVLNGPSILGIGAVVPSQETVDLKCIEQRLEYTLQRLA